MLSIIIPTLNEEEAIAKVLCSIPEEVRKDAEVLVVDVSNDLTPQIAERLGAKVIKSPEKGKGRQMRLGVEKSKGDVLIFLDGDGTDPPEYIPKMLKKLETADLVLGCRSNKRFREDNKGMRNVYKFYSLLVQPLFFFVGLKASDPLAGFRAIRRKDWDRLDLKSDKFEIETEMGVKAMKQGFVIKEIQIPHLKRGGGLTKSKFGTNPKMWFRVLGVVLKYLKDEKIKVSIKKLKQN